MTLALNIWPSARKQLCKYLKFLIFIFLHWQRRSQNILHDFYGVRHGRKRVRKNRHPQKSMEENKIGLKVRMRQQKQYSSRSVLDSELELGSLDMKLSIEHKESQR